MQQQSASCQQAFGQLCDRLASGACTESRGFLLQKIGLLETLEGNPQPSSSSLLVSRFRVLSMGFCLAHRDVVQEEYLQVLMCGQNKFLPSSLGLPLGIWSLECWDLSGDSS